MIASGWLVDKLGSARTLPLYQLPMAAAFVCFSIAESSVMLAIGLLCLALSAGANSTLPNVFWAEFYGTRHIGAIKAMAAAVMVLGSAIGPLLTGTLIDFGIGLERQFIGIALFFFVATAGMGAGVLRYRDSVPSYLARRK
jgi:MFS family permease